MSKLFKKKKKNSLGMLDYYIAKSQRNVGWCVILIFSAGSWIYIYILFFFPCAEAEGIQSLITLSSLSDQRTSASLPQVAAALLSYHRLALKLFASTRYPFSVSLFSNELRVTCSFLFFCLSPVSSFINSYLLGSVWFQEDVNNKKNVMLVYYEFSVSSEPK